MLNVSYAWYMRKSLAICARPAIDVARDTNKDDLIKLRNSLGGRTSADALANEIENAFHEEESKYAKTV